MFVSSPALRRLPRAGPVRLRPWCALRYSAVHAPTARREAAEPAMHLPPGPERPSAATLERFWAAARAAVPSLANVTGYGVRWIGLDAPTTRQIFDLIRARDKTGTFTLPWIAAATGQPASQPGDCIVLMDFDGTPTLLVRLTRVHEVAFGAMTAADTAVDGTPVRALEVWKPLHTDYWNAKLRPFGRTVTPDMPVWVEAFELVYDAERRD
jgi:uncharacterized protein YhfF